MAHARPDACRCGWWAPLALTLTCEERQRGFLTFIMARYLASSSCCRSEAVSVILEALLAARSTRSWGDLVLPLCSTFFMKLAMAADGPPPGRLPKGWRVAAAALQAPAGLCWQLRSGMRLAASPTDSEMVLLSAAPAVIKPALLGFAVEHRGAYWASGQQNSHQPARPAA